MYRNGIGEITHRLVYSAVVFSLAVVALWFAAINKTAASPEWNSAPAKLDLSAPATVFQANPGTLGAIPDGGIVTECGSDGTPLDVTFTVSGVTGPLTNVEVGMTLNPEHTYRGDLGAVLIAPNGTSFTLFKYIGSTVDAGCGSSNHFAGPYNLKDSATGINIWTDFSPLDTSTTPAGDYRTTASGGAGQTNPAPVTNLTAAFSGLTTAQINGTWKLRMTDGGLGDTGTMSAATLTLTAGSSLPKQHIVDFDGDGKTDVCVVRNVGGSSGGGPIGQIGWFYNTNPSVAQTLWFNWGLVGDHFISGDFDGDGKSDIAVWREQSDNNGIFYILNSNGFTLRQELFGKKNDDPTVVADYDGDGKTDIAVYRPGATSADQSKWLYRTSQNGPIISVVWGVGGDKPVPGDFNGDGKADFVVARAESGQNRYWQLLTSGLSYITDSTVVFGMTSDSQVPGDYNGDLKTDIAVTRNVGTVKMWYIRYSGTGMLFQQPFGTLSDYSVQGDYDGDGKTDIAIYRTSTTPGASAFWYQGSTGVVGSIPFGSSGDYPVANFNTH